MKKLFMCPPTYFEIEYSINVWTDMASKIDHKEAMAEWRRLHDIYVDLGLDVKTVPPLPEAVELTFIGDSVFLYGDKAISSRFRHTERSGEIPASRSFFEAQGFEIHQLPEGVHYEGNGDSMIWNGIMLGGYGVRSDKSAYEFIEKTLDIETIPLNLVAPFYHLDLVLCPINSSTLAFYPGAFKPESQARIESLADNIIRVGREPVMNFALNGKAIRDVMIYNDMGCCPNYEAELESLGMRIFKVDTSEFNKAGGAAKCITLEHYGPS